MAAIIAPLFVAFATTCRADVLAGEQLAAKGSEGVPPCVQCHGLHGEGQAAAGFPRLAGQVKPYIEKELHDFHDGRRTNAVMQPIAHAMSDRQISDAAAYYSSLAAPVVRPNAARGKQSASAGERLAQRGNWDGNIPACFACHGKNGRGVPPHFPAIAGQHATYTARQLRDWQNGARSNDPQGLMKAVSSRLDQKQIDAVSSYLQSLE